VNLNSKPCATLLPATPTKATIVTGTDPQEYELEVKRKSGEENAVHLLGRAAIGS
jgi:hypothetical protein